MWLATFKMMAFQTQAFIINIYDTFHGPFLYLELTRSLWVVLTRVLAGRLCRHSSNAADSVLAQPNISATTADLPFRTSGFIMAQGFRALPLSWIALWNRSVKIRHLVLLQMNSLTKKIRIYSTLKQAFKTKFLCVIYLFMREKKNLLYLKPAAGTSGIVQIPTD